MTRLTSEEIQKRREFTDKLKYKTITTNEAQELKKILEKEKKQAESSDDWVVLLGILLLLGLVLAFIGKK